MAPLQFIFRNNNKTPNHKIRNLEHGIKAYIAIFKNMMYIVVNICMANFQDCFKYSRN